MTNSIDWSAIKQSDKFSRNLEAREKSQGIDWNALLLREMRNEKLLLPALASGGIRFSMVQDF